MSFPFKTTEGLLWVGVEALPLGGQKDVLDFELIWPRDVEHAEALCSVRVIQSVVFERAGKRVRIDYGSESFSDFMEVCRWELAFNDWDDEEEEALTREALRLLYAATEKGGAK